uniref:Uncharacterized protein n=1 Tax=Arundo donax TaxID=35708 RepID=A0A0A8YRX7_ARUDO
MRQWTYLRGPILIVLGGGAVAAPFFAVRRKAWCAAHLARPSAAVAPLCTHASTPSRCGRRRVKPRRRRPPP